MRRFLVMLLVVSVIVGCRGSHMSPPRSPTPLTAPPATANSSPTRPNSVAIPTPTAIATDAGALREAVDILFGSDPPDVTLSLQSARYVLTSGALAGAIIGRQNASPAGDIPVWLFVFTGDFAEENRFVGVVATFHTAFVVVDGLGGFIPGFMQPTGLPYDLSPAGYARTVDPNEIRALVNHLRCEGEHPGELEPIECPTPAL
jgi:hypothetical protein